MTREENIKLFLDTLKKVKRDGIEELIGYLVNDTDFFDAPASTKYHCNYEGGLVEHSLNVYRCLLDKVKNSLVYKQHKNLSDNYSSESFIIVALLHDICKSNYYEQYDKWIKDAKDKWITEKSYKVNDMFPYGHGEKSVLIISKFIDLTDDEIIAIRWHMGLSEAKEAYQVLGQALSKYPLTLALIEADLEATYILENKELVDNNEV